jgi:hypothetical protein
VLRGTGANFFVQSQTFNTTWINSALTINQTATTAPNGTSTGNSLIPTVANTIHRINSPSITAISGVTYTVSVYAKANGYNYLFVNCQAAFNANTTFNLSTGAISTTANGTATITDAGNGWYRCTVTGTAVSTSTNIPFFQVNNTQTGATDDTYAGNGTSGIFLWGAQYEIGSTANTYIPTTTTAVYGTPTLSFSGVSTIGLQSDGALFVQPAGTGALQAQATTSTTAGGNARGANAVDFQTFTRGAASQVASGLASSILGGARNTSNSIASVVVCGTDNTAGANSSFVGAGTTNTANGTSNAIVSGLNNSTSGTFAFIGAGQANTAAGYHNFIGGGQTNSGTASAAVTTQSGTMNGTTAVTLSGSNANIKVGQLITGTSIVTASGTTPFTYVAAISGTSLTLSQNASGSSTSTLSFFTPHGVVVGGGNNQATGSYSFIGGGGDAGTAANRNTASADWGTVVGGRANLASAVSAFVGGGGTDGANTGGNTASGIGSSVLGGFSNQASGQWASVSGGLQNLANGFASIVVNGRYGSTRGIVGNISFPASNVPIAQSGGASQSALLVLGRQTTDATATALTSDTSAAGTTNQVILPNNSAYFFTGEVVSGVTGGGNTKGWTIEGVIKRGANAASTALVGTPTVTSTYADAGASTWVIAVTADTTNGGIRVTFTGQAATTIRTVCSIRTVEMTY